MGYCYDTRTGQLVCDSCGIHGGVRRVKCKYGYCPALALCASCRKNPEIKTERAAFCDANCKEAAARFAALDAAIKEALDSGHYVFCSSVYAKGSDRTEVEMTFRNADGDYRTLVVPMAVRERFEYGQVTTYDDVKVAS